MKKYAILLLLLLLVGCDKKETPVSLSKLAEPLTELSVNPFDPSRVVATIEKKQFEIPLRNLTPEELSSLGITELLEDGIFRSSTKENNVEFYYILKPIEGKENEIKQLMSDYFTELQKKTDEEEKQVIYETRLEEEYQGYLLYVGSKNAKTILEEIKKVKTLVYPNWRTLEEAELKNYGLKKGEVESFLIGKSADLKQNRFFVAVRPKKGTSVKEQLEQEKEKRIKASSGEEEKQYQASVIKEVNGVTVWIMNPEHDLILQTIEKILKK